MVACHWVVVAYIGVASAWSADAVVGMRARRRIAVGLRSGAHMMADADDGEPKTVEVLSPQLPPEDLSAPSRGTRDGSGNDLALTIGPDSQLVKPEDLDVSGLLTESQRRRLAPIKSLKRTRRSRKVRTVGDKDDKYVPLVPGARASTDESIIAAFSGETLGAKREQGEDYYVDPELLKDELEREAVVTKRRKRFKLKKDSYAEDKLKQELAAPYKNNVIGTIVIGVGVIAVFFAAFPGLLEENLAPSIASFPDTL